MNGSDINTQLLQAVLAAPLQTKKAALRFITQGPVVASGPIFITGAKAARRLGVSKSTFRRWAKATGLRRWEVLPDRFRYRTEDIETMARNAEAVS